jgi:type VI secretion system protein ImpE
VPEQNMSVVTTAEQSLRDGDPAAALVLLQDEVRAKPANAKLRVFLFQLLCVRGQWERALNQLKVAAELDASALAMAQMYGDAVRCEAVRRDVFDGKKSPMVFGEPEQWLALLIESLLVNGTPRADQAQGLRERAFESAPTTSGSLDGEPFEWIADADMRLGPVCEAVINGRYYWLPFANLSRVDLEAPADLRDVVWMPAHFQFANGGESVGVIPTRYPGSESSDDPLIRLGRKTVWQQEAADVFSGLGQRILTTDKGEHGVMDVRSILLAGAAADAVGAEHA